MADLKLCPFCGGKGYMTTTHEDGVAWHQIKCEGCGATTRGKWHSPGNDCPQLREEVRDEWNQRVSPPPSGTGGSSDA